MKFVCCVQVLCVLCILEVVSLSDLDTGVFVKNYFHLKLLLTSQEYKRDVVVNPAVLVIFHSACANNVASLRHEWFERGPKALHLMLLLHNIRPQVPGKTCNKHSIEDRLGTSGNDCAQVMSIPNICVSCTLNSSSSPGHVVSIRKSYNKSSKT